MDKPSATAIEKSVAGNKTRDKAFAIVGLIATFVGMLTLAALLFDLASDPGEYHNVAKNPDYDATVSELRGMLLQRVMNAERPLNRAWTY